MVRVCEAKLRTFCGTTEKSGWSALVSHFRHKLTSADIIVPRGVENRVAMSEFLQVHSLVT